MSKLFVRERRQIGAGAGQPRFRIVATEGLDMRVYVPHMRRVELEQLAAATGTEIVYLTRGDQEGESGHGRGEGRRHGHRMQSEDWAPVPRPRKRRTVAMPSQPMIYKPASIPLEGLRRVVLLPEELEALRLTDLEDLTQEDAAERMGVSRSTFQRTISQTHRQVALALSEGAALAIEGATVDRAPRHARQSTEEGAFQ